MDAASGELRKYGSRIRVQRLPFELLLALLHRPGEVITREELQQQLWGNDTFVDFEQGLNVAVKKLRQSLGDPADSPRFIETLPSRGYRFLVAVERLPADTADARSTSVGATKDATRRPDRRALWLFSGLFLLGCFISYWLAARRLPLDSTEVIKFRVPTPEGYMLQPSAIRQGFAISPNGSRLAFTALDAQGRFTLWVQELSGLDPRPVPRTEGTYGVTWAPDSRSLYFTMATGLRRTKWDEDAPMVVCEVPPRMIGVLPLNSGELVLTGASGTFVVPAEGGKPQPLIGINYKWPQMLPDNKHLLSLQYDEQIDQNRLVVVPYGSATPAVEIMETDSRVEYAPSTTKPDSGYLLYVRAGNLVAQPFDPKTFRVVGRPTPIASDVYFYRTAGAADFSVSANGALAYLPTVGRSQLAWVDRDGREVASVGPRNVIVKYARISPDGRMIAAPIYNLEKGISQAWTFDLATGAARQVTDFLGLVESPVWSPDSRRLAYGRTSGHPPFLYVKGLGQNDPEEALPRDHHQFPSDWSPDGRFLAYSSLHYASTEAESNGNVVLVDLKNDNQLIPLLSSSFRENGAVFSPDGNWLAFVTSESGRPEVYVQAFEANDAPRLIGERRQVSRGGAHQVRWPDDSGELFYLGMDYKIYAVALKLYPTLQVEAPQALFSVDKENRAVSSISFGFDVSADGKRFVVPVLRDPRRSSIVVIKNWEELLRPQPR